MAIVQWRFYAELNIFLQAAHRQRLFRHACPADASVKHMIEALGVPHTEVELILVDGSAADFSYRLQDGDRISVYPWLALSDGPARLPGSLRLSGPRRFIADAHLGRLARNLRMLGFDVLYRNNFSDAEIARAASEENRIVLTRDRDLLIRKSIARGCYVHRTAPRDQLHEVVARYRLAEEVQMLSRCLDCNCRLSPVDKSIVQHRLPARSGRFSQQFFLCADCDRVYWDGSHSARMREQIAALLRQHQGMR